MILRHLNVSSHYRTTDKQADVGCKTLGKRHKHFWWITLPLGFFCNGTFKHLLHPATLHCDTVITYQWCLGGICTANLYGISRFLGKRKW